MPCLWRVYDLECAIHSTSTVHTCVYIYDYNIGDFDFPVLHFCPISNITSITHDSTSRTKAFTILTNLLITNLNSNTRKNSCIQE